MACCVLSVCLSVSSSIANGPMLCERDKNTPRQRQHLAAKHCTIYQLCQCQSRFMCVYGLFSNQAKHVKLADGIPLYYTLISIPFLCACALQCDALY